MRAGDSQLFSNIAATTAPFVLRGGLYVVTVAATFSAGSVKLQRQLPDKSAFISVGSSTDFTANGSTILNLGPGTYEFVIATATGVTAEIIRIPGE
jgi:hypothetical protein